jgi:hypothetical protein
MKEQDYIDMSNHFKETYEKMETKLLEKDAVIKELKKVIMFNYSFARLIDEQISEMDLPIGCPLNVYSETLRGKNSECIDEILGINNIEIHLHEVNISS